VISSVVKHRSKNAKIFNGLRYVVTAFLILWTPYYVFADVNIFYNTFYPGESALYAIVSWLSYMYRHIITSGQRNSPSQLPLTS